MRIFLPTPHNIKVSGSMDTSRYGTKVIFWISGIRGGKRRLIRGNLTAVYGFLALRLDLRLLLDIWR